MQATREAIMSNQPPDPATPSADRLARVENFSADETHEEPNGEEILPGWDIPMAMPVAEPMDDESIPVGAFRRACGARGDRDTRGDSCHTDGTAYRPGRR